MDKDKTIIDSGVSYEIENNQMIIDFSKSDQIESLAEGVTSEQSFDYEVSDGSLVFAVDDFFNVAPNSIGVSLNVLANDRDFYNKASDTENAQDFEIVSVSTPNQGGSVNVVTSNEGNTVLIYNCLLYTSDAADE